MKPNPSTAPAPSLEVLVSFIKDMKRAGLPTPEGLSPEEWASKWFESHPELKAGENGKVAKTLPGYIRTNEAAEYLGNIPLRSFKQYVKERRLPSYKMGKSRLFKIAELDAAMTKTRVYAISDILS